MSYLKTSAPNSYTSIIQHLWQRRDSLTICLDTHFSSPSCKWPVTASLRRLYPLRNALQIYLIMVSGDFPLRITSNLGWKVLFRLGRKGSDQIQSLCSNHGTKARMWPEIFMFLCLHLESPVQPRLILFSNSFVPIESFWKQMLFHTLESDLHCLSWPLWYFSVTF